MIIENCNVSKLLDELNAKGIYPNPVFNNGDGSGNFTFFDGTDMTLVQQIIDAHDPTPTPIPPTEIEILKTEQAKANAEMINLMMSMLGGAM